MMVKHRAPAKTHVGAEKHLGLGKKALGILAGTD
jgi:hypothetical protein